jgi:hypothetical protein
MTKKPWKPYDVEQAKAEIKAECDRLANSTMLNMAQATDIAVARLETEAAAFKSMPPDVASLFTASDHVSISEIDFGHYLNQLTHSKDVELFEVVARFQNFGDVRLVYPVNNGRGPKLTAKKYRVLTFFVPVEE